MELHLKEKKALITGSSRGLGFATARLLAQEGTIVTINSRDAGKLDAASKQITSETQATVFPVAGDVADPQFVETLVQEAATQMGGLDILITNAGGPPAGGFESFNDSAWQKAVDLSLMAHVRLIRAALKYLKQSHAASILTITSVSVKQPIQNLILSNSVRAATVGLTKSLALELGPMGIRVNSILPGWTATERVSELLSTRAKANGTTLEDEMTKQAKECALGRIAKPEEFANVAVFLVSPAASYVTGVMLNVDGGSYKGIF